MAKIQILPKREEFMPTSVPSLSSTVRRQLGKSLRSYYAESMNEPVSERIEALLARLDVPRR